MTEQDKTLEPEVVACSVCLKEVPASESRSEEALDYIVHFCGLDCYQAWHKEQAADAHTDEG
jgi:hypothetical protein